MGSRETETLYIGSAWLHPATLRLREGALDRRRACAIPHLLARDYGRSFSLCFEKVQQGDFFVDGRVRHEQAVRVAGLSVDFLHETDPSEDPAHYPECLQKLVIINACTTFRWSLRSSNQPFIYARTLSKLFILGSDFMPAVEALIDKSVILVDYWRLKKRAGGGGLSRRRRRIVGANIQTF